MEGIQVGVAVSDWANCGQVLKLGDSNNLLNFLQDMENGQQTAHYFASPDFIARAQIISDVVTTPSRTQTLIQTPRGIWQVVVLVMECPGGSCMCLDDYLCPYVGVKWTVSHC